MGVLPMIFIDSNSVSSFYAYSKKGFSSNMVSFLDSLLEYDRNIVFCFDGNKAGEFKKNRFPSYKQNRISSVVLSQNLSYLNDIFAYAKKNGFPIIKHDLLEADDVILGMTHEVKKEVDSTIIVVSHDQDLFQGAMYWDNYVVCRSGKSNFAKDYSNFSRPEQAMKFAEKMWKGDKSDGLPSVSGMYRRKEFDLIDTVLSVAVFDKYCLKNDICRLCRSFPLFDKIVAQEQEMFDGGLF